MTYSFRFICLSTQSNDVSREPICLETSVLFRTGQSPDLFVPSLEKLPPSQSAIKCLWRWHADVYDMWSPCPRGSPFSWREYFESSNIPAFDRTPPHREGRAGRINRGDVHVSWIMVEKCRWGCLKYSQGAKSEIAFTKEGSTQTNSEHAPLRGPWCPSIWLDPVKRKKASKISWLPI